MANISGYIQCATSIKANPTEADETFTLIGTNSAATVCNLSKITNLTVNPSTGILSGVLNGNAATATKVAVSNNNTTSTFYPVFASAAGTAIDLQADTATGPLTYVPSTGLLSAIQLAGTTSVLTPNINNPNGTLAIQNIAASTNIGTFQPTADNQNNISIGNTAGLYSQTISIGRNNCLEVINGSTINNTSGLARGAVRINANNGNGTTTINSVGSATGSIEIGSGNGSGQTVDICNGDPFGGTLNICNKALSGTLNIASGSNSSNTKTGPINFAFGDNTGLLSIGNMSRNIDIRGGTVQIFPTTLTFTGTNVTFGSSNCVINSPSITLGNASTNTSVVRINQDTASLLSNSPGYTTTASGTFTISVSGNSGYFQATTLSMPARQVSLIKISCSWTPAEAVLSTRFGVALSASTASSTEAAAGLSTFSESNFESNSVLQEKRVLSGVYVNTGATITTLYLNCQQNQNFVTNGPVFGYSYSITKIG
jgi:hypothetical protein